MSWGILQKPSFYLELLDAPRDLQKRVIQALEDDLIRDPVTPRGNTIKPLKGWDNVWRYRVGDFRIIYAASPEREVIQLLAFGPRDSVYERFNYDGWEEEDAQVTFGADLAPKRHVDPAAFYREEWFRPQEEKGTPLPRILSPALLARWQVPEAYRPVLMRCRTEEELLSADVPDKVLEPVLNALFPPSAEKIARQPDYVLADPADLERFAQGTLRAFLLKLDDTQQGLTDWALSGPTLVKGGPGSGKSTVALYRVRALIRRHLAEHGRLPRILFTTYTNALTKASASLLDQLLSEFIPRQPDGTLAIPREIEITNIDKVVARIVNTTRGRFRAAGYAQERQALRDARDGLSAGTAGDMERLLARMALQDMREGYLLDEIQWVIEGQNCSTLDDYLAANRAGRAIPFNRNMRETVWQLYEGFRAALSRRKLTTWGQVRQQALAALQSGAVDASYDYVLVDEAQDLTPAAIAVCVELCRSPAGLFLTADANQSLYNQGFRWQDVHQQLRVVGRTRILRRNYRSTREIAAAAADVLQPADGDPEAQQQEYVHRGEPPLIYAADGAGDQARWLARQMVRAAKALQLPVNAMAALVPTNKLGETLAQALRQAGLNARYVSGQNLSLEERCVKVLTLHAAKGLEFPVVAVAHVEADRLPRVIDTADEKDLDEHLAAQRRLLYVGCTRAMRYLFITYDKSLPSPFIDNLSDDRWLRLAAGEEL